MSKSNGNGDWKKDDGTGPVSRKTYDKLRRRLNSANEAIAARYRDLDAAVAENHILAEKVKSAEQITMQHKQITTNMERMHREQRVELESEIAERARVERELRKELVRLKSAGND